MTSDTAGDILDISPSSAARYGNDGLLRRTWKVDPDTGHGYWDLNGQDVQAMRNLRDRLGSREGTAAMREKARKAGRVM
jgi:hypothetical protein